jgi:hypothetical protein
MKRIIPLGNNRYIHVDLYKEYRPPITKVLVPLFVTIIAAMTAGAIVGIDVTNIPLSPTQQQTK